MPTETSKLFSPLPGLSIGMEQFDVRDVRHWSPLAAFGRYIGGCGICGTIACNSWCQCLENHGHVCQRCYYKYIEHYLPDGSYMLPDNPKHPYHVRVR